jgi:ABC-three component (ABC-3C) system Middle Component 3
VTATLAREVEAVQNPGFGAVLLWRFAVGYAQARQAPQSTPFPVLFVPLPILFLEESAELLSSTLRPSGLRAFVDKFGQAAHSKSDVLLSLERRAVLFRTTSLESLRLAIRSRLLFLQRSTAEVVALSQSAPKTLPASTHRMLSGAEKLGAWCGEVTLFELSSLLHVSL